MLGVKYIQPEGRHRPRYARPPCHGQDVGVMGGCTEPGYPEHPFLGVGLARIAWCHDGHSMACPAECLRERFHRGRQAIDQRAIVIREKPDPHPGTFRAWPPSAMALEGPPQTLAPGESYGLTTDPWGLNTAGHFRVTGVCVMGRPRASLP